MKYKRSFRPRDFESLVDPLFAEELSGPRRPDRPSESKLNRKAQQLCRQVQRALSLSLAGECGDDLLRELSVQAVLPAPDSSHLLVRLAVPDRCRVPLVEILQRLERVQGRLRPSMAHAICRKRVPELSFMPVWGAEEVP